MMTKELEYILCTISSERRSMYPIWGIVTHHGRKRAHWSSLGTMKEGRREEKGSGGGVINWRSDELINWIWRECRGIYRIISITQGYNRLGTWFWGLDGFQWIKEALSEKTKKNMPLMLVPNDVHGLFIQSLRNIMRKIVERGEKMQWCCF